MSTYSRLILGSKLVKGCWEWQGWVDENGYGRIQSGGKRHRAHRLAWETTFGAIPLSLLVCHRCDNRKCVNPDHLFLGTHTDNARDRSAKNRSNRPTGALNHFYKYPRELVDQCASLRTSGLKRKEIAKILGLSSNNVDSLYRRIKLEF